MVFPMYVTGFVATTCTTMFESFPLFLTLSEPGLIAFY